MNSGQPADHEIEDAARPDLVPGVEPYALPTADDVKALALFPFAEHGKEARDLGGVVLQVSVECEDDIAARRAEAGRQRRGLAEVATEADAMYLRMLARQLGDDLPGTVAAAVVDE